MNLLALLALLQIARVNAAGMLLLDQELPLKKCRHFKGQHMVQVLCKDLKLADIPTNLQSDIEVMDARLNRIRELRNDSLTRYTDLRFLYLADNFVNTISEDAFAPTYYLEVLDLTTNGLSVLPKSLFRMNQLRTLYLSDNLLSDSVFDVTGVTAPLRLLHLHKNKLKEIPRLSPVPFLLLLNVSHNLIERVAPEDIATMCSLQQLDLTDNPIKFDQNTCECYVFKDWIKFRNITLNMSVKCPQHMNKTCTLGQYDDPELRFSNRTMSLYNGCLSTLKTRVETQKARTTWIWIASCVGAFVACIFVALCCMHSNNKNKRRHLKEQNMLTVNNANTTEQLLNKEAKHDAA